MFQTIWVSSCLWLHSCFLISGVINTETRINMMHPILYVKRCGWRDVFLFSLSFLLAIAGWMKITRDSCGSVLWLSSTDISCSAYKIIIMVKGMLSRMQGVLWPLLILFQGSGGGGGESERGRVLPAFCIGISPMCFTVSVTHTETPAYPPLWVWERRTQTWLLRRTSSHLSVPTVVWEKANPCLQGQDLGFLHFGTGFCSVSCFLC